MLIAISFISLLAFLMSTVCGGGAGLLLLPLLNAVLPSSQVPAALSIGTATSSVSRLAVFWREVHWGLVRRFVPGALLGCWLGVFLLSRLNPTLIEFALSLFLLSNLPLLLRPPMQNSAVLDPAAPASLAIGLVAGFTSGLTGAVGVLFNGYYFRCGLNKKQVVASRAANEVLLHLLKLALYTHYGFMNRAVLGFGLTVALSALLANALADSVLRWFSETTFRRMGYAAMVLSGAFLFLGSTQQIVRQNRLQASLQANREGHLEARIGWSERDFLEVDLRELELETSLWSSLRGKA